MKTIKYASLLLGLSALSAPALATPAITFTGGAATSSFPGRTLGYEFTVTSQITISALGLWDEAGDGLLESHQVGIWTGDGSTSLAQAVIPGGAVGWLDSGFRFVAIGSVVLNPGTYIAGAYTGQRGDSVIRFTTATTIPQITLGSTRFDLPIDGVYKAPTGTQGTTFDSGYFGPNFIVGGAVPEPASWAMMIGGFALAGAAMRRRTAVRFA